jgi:hypothetical protein
MRTKMPLYLTFVLAVLGLAALLTIQPYSADWPGRAYKKPAQRYVLAALRQDSVALARLSAGLAPVVWALNAARRRPLFLALWAKQTQAWTGDRRGDTADVFLYPSSKTCGETPIVFRFVGSGNGARVLSAGSACLDQK